jgi:hypothetical protein
MAKILPFKPKLPVRKPGVAQAEELGEAAKLALDGKKLDTDGARVRQKEE